jgi:hypothetical protein
MYNNIYPASLEALAMELHPHPCGGSRLFGKSLALGSWTDDNGGYVMSFLEGSSWRPC